MRNILFIIASLCIILSSCEYRESYTFNSDWSGSYSAVLDMSALVEMGGEESMDKELIPEEEAVKLVNKMNSITGISNSKVIEDQQNYMITISYDYEDLKALNTMNATDLTEDDDSAVSSIGKWQMSTKGKKFFMTMIDLEGMQSDSDSEEAKKAGEMLNVSTTLVFPNKVKSIKGDMAKKGDSPNEVLIQYTAKDMWDISKNWEIEVKF